MNLKSLRIFKTVVEEGSLTKASKKLYIAQPSISLYIKDLENYYNTKLFDRISKKMILTEKGKELYEYSCHLLEMIDEIEYHMNTNTSLIKIGSSITYANYVLIDILKDYQSINDSPVKLFVNNSKAILNMILESKIDFAVVEGSVDNDKIHSEKIYSDEMAFVCSTSYPATINSFRDLLKYPILTRDKGSAHRELLESLSKLNDVELNIAMESSDTQAILEACKKNLGIAFLPMDFIDKDLYSELKLINLEKIKRNYYLIYHKKKYLNSNSKVLIELMKSKNR